MKINSFFKDLSALKNVGAKRRERIMHASPKPLRHDPIKALARILHPEENVLVISSILDVSENVKIIKFTNKPESGTRFPIFQSGQYLSLKIELENSTITRPYFIFSPPFEALLKDNITKKSEPYIEIIVEKIENGIASQCIWNNWKIGTEVKVSFPHGKFYYEPLRDTSNIIAFAENMGISPFYSMMKEIYAEKIKINLTLVFKKKSLEHTILLEEIKKMVEKHPEKLKLVLLDDTMDFSDVLNKFNRETLMMSTFFICGDENMYQELSSQLIKLKVSQRRIRKQIYGETTSIYNASSFPEDAKEKIFKITVNNKGEEKVFDAYSNETIMVALEKAGVKKDSHCRVGECGYCRSRIIKGDILVNSFMDKRRTVDVQFGYFHPCVSYPVSDLVIDILI